MRDIRLLGASFLEPGFGRGEIYKHNADHGVSAVKDLYIISQDWTGRLYCGLTLKWDYVNFQERALRLPDSKTQGWGGLMKFLAPPLLYGPVIQGKLHEKSCWK